MNLEERFWAKVDKTPTCWNWVGALSGGYGHINAFKERGTLLKAHRLSWELHHNCRIPTGLSVLHRCDNPKCVNPDHLFLGTRDDNMKDAARKGRIKSDVRERNRVVKYPGEANGNSKLTAARVRVIREEAADGMPYTEIASLFGVTPTNVGYIVRRLTWRGV